MEMCTKVTRSLIGISDRQWNGFDRVCLRLIKEEPALAEPSLILLGLRASQGFERSDFFAIGIIIMFIYLLYQLCLSLDLVDK